MAHDVFISHSSKDKSIADAICAILESRKIRCWVAPRDIQPGAIYAGAIMDAINKSCIMVLVFSSQSNMSKQVYREVERAVSKGITIIPFRIEDVPMSETMEYFLSSTHWLDALSTPLEKHIEHLAETIKGILMQPRSDAESGTEYSQNTTDQNSSIKNNVNKKGQAWFWGTIIIIIIVLSIYLGFSANRISEFEQIVLAAYNSGEYSDAREKASILMEKHPESGFSYLILGNIYFLEGDLRTAESYYKKGEAASRITNDQHAEILMGLGRIASIKAKNDEAVQYYRMASDLTPGIDRTYASQAILLDRLGKYDQALVMFNKAGEVSRFSQSYTSMAKEVEKKVALKNDQEKQNQIDALVKDLLENMNESKPSPAKDGWTSLPLTIWMMDLDNSGYSIQEGKEQLIGSCLIDNLINKSRARIVERSLLDAILKELKLGSSSLTEQSTALSLGRIMAARLIISGKVHYIGPSVQVTLRLIETETGQIRGAINEEFKTETDPSEIAGKLTVSLLEKLNVLYPLRGIIVDEIDNGMVTINIGQDQGLQVGQKLKASDTDQVFIVESVEPDRCSARLIEGITDINKGLSVEQI